MTGLTNGVQYAFVYCPVVGSTIGAPSSVITATPGTTPTQVAATASGTSVSVTWTPVQGATSYNVYLATGTAALTSSPKVATVTGASATILGLTPGSEYSLVVTNFNVIESAPSSVVTLSLAPSRPVAPVATSGSNSAIFVWAPVAGATTYNLFYSTSSTVSASTGSKVPSVLSGYALTSLAPSTTYSAVITAQNSGGESEGSVTVAFTTCPATLANLSAAAAVSTVGLTWSPSSGATSYNLYWSTTTGVTPSKKRRQT